MSENTMTAQERIERVLKDLGKLKELASRAGTSDIALADKVLMQRTVGELAQARCIVRRTLFVIEDAERMTR